MAKKMKGTSFKKLEKELMRDKKYLKASLKLYQESNADYFQEICIARKALEILDETNPARMALQQMDLIEYKEILPKWYVKSRR